VLAVVGVTHLTYQVGEIPLVALVLAGSFGFYGLLRKTAKVDALVGLTVETMLLFPLALAYLALAAVRRECVFGSESWRMDLLLAAAGVITAAPLLWFTNAARRLRLATLGFLQYIAPTGHFLLAVVVFGEPFSRADLISFACIWTALLIYSLDTARDTGPAVSVRAC
jgi:chloramphenicol-sensitive protein RarD